MAVARFGISLPSKPAEIRFQSLSTVVRSDWISSPGWREKGVIVGGEPLIGSGATGGTRPLRRRRGVGKSPIVKIKLLRLARRTSRHVGRVGVRGGIDVAFDSCGCSRRCRFPIAGMVEGIRRRIGRVIRCIRTGIALVVTAAVSLTHPAKQPKCRTVINLGLARCGSRSQCKNRCKRATGEQLQLHKNTS